MTIGNALRAPTAFLPLGLSGAGMGVVLLRLLLVGTEPEMAGGRPDEGLVAHLWQLFIFAQLPIIVAFLIRRLRRGLPETLLILGLQVLAIGAAALPVFLLGW